MAEFKRGSGDYISGGAAGVVVGAIVVGVGVALALPWVAILGYVIGTVASAVLLVGLIAQGVKVGMRDARGEEALENAALNRADL